MSRRLICSRVVESFSIEAESEGEISREREGFGKPPGFYGGF